MIDFKKKMEEVLAATEAVNNILSKRYDNFDQYEEVNKIEDLSVAKLVIKRLLDEINKLS